jgi:hypothetical protein
VTLLTAAPVPVPATAPKPTAAPSRRRALLDAGWVPLVFGLASALLTWYVWGSFRQHPFIADEAAYVLQSKIFARGHWTAPAPPLAEFFEQSYVLLQPAIAAKYPPGHALLLAIGMVLGLPGLMPVLLAGLAGALVFALARKASGSFVAVLTWLVWASTIDVVRYHATYLSEVTTGALWLVAWWGLLRWKEGSASWLVVVAAALAWSAITRPLTGVALAIPVLVVVARQVLSRRTWRELGAPVLVGGAILALVPVWSQRTTGSWRLTPLMAYTQTYMPSDVPGFGLSSQPAQVRLPPDQDEIEQIYRIHRARHTAESLPTTLLQRLAELEMHYCGSGWRLVLLPFAILGVFALTGTGWFALSGAAVLLLIYLSYAHPAFWTLYYLEINPVLAFVTAIGLWTVMRRLRVVPAPALALVASILLCLGLARTSYRVHQTLGRLRRPQVALDAAARALPARRSIIFVRYGPGHYAHLSLIRNEPFLAESRTWFVYDHGSDNARLIAAAPDRVPYLADEASERFIPLKPDGLP